VNIYAARPTEGFRVGSRKPWIVLLALMAGILAAGCAEENAKLTETKNLVVGDIGWDEGVAVSNLTKALLEDELGYESVELRTLDIASLCPRRPLASNPTPGGRKALSRVPKRSPLFSTSSTHQSTQIL
jgi:hypothetical protein